MNLNAEKKVVKSGFLEKRSKYLKIWKRRYIVLTNKNIFAFTSDESDADCTMNLMLKTCEKVEISDTELGKEFTFAVTEEERKYYFQASSEEERNEWLRCIQLEISCPSEK